MPLHRTVIETTFDNETDDEKSGCLIKIVVKETGFKDQRKRHEGVREKARELQSLELGQLIAEPSMVAPILSNHYTVYSSLKVESQVDRTVKKVFGTLAIIRHYIEYKSWEVMLQLYRTL
eukprot:g33278.t1